ncbi:hypothetical protein [Xenorhabdus sp. Sc-CR9]|uniref:hypothetical protein n=1 Tax=Xenorhabdus sp. Sc-CR9 TaxID=2584468 RepID=UPI001F2C2440|nr:hypothetical protein [Xenorhabdus sp. Sc-CR9]
MILSASAKCSVAKSVTAWASRCVYANFSKLGGVSVWRELRHLKEINLPDDKIKAVWQAAYTQAQGEP